MRVLNRLDVSGSFGLGSSAQDEFVVGSPNLENNDISTDNLKVWANSDFKNNVTLGSNSSDIIYVSGTLINEGGASLTGSFSGSGQNLTNIPNSGLQNYEINLNGSNIALGGTASVGTLRDITAGSNILIGLVNATTRSVSLDTNLVGLNSVTASSFVGNLTGSFTASNPSIIDVSSTETALRVTQRGAGDAIRVEDDPTSPDSTPFIVKADGRVGIGTAIPSASLDIRGGLLISNNLNQTSSVNSIYSVAFGLDSRAPGTYSFSQGYGNIASGTYSHAQGFTTIAEGRQSHAEGSATYALGPQSHAEGFGTKAYVSGSHAEGADTQASGNYSHTEGWLTKTEGQFSHTEGFFTTASGPWSHAEGEGCVTLEGATGAHAEGQYTIASASYQHVQGRYNQTSSALMIVGNGGSVNSRSNILEVYSSTVGVTGSVLVTNGTFRVTGSNAENFIDVNNSTNALRITQKGSGDAIRVEDEVNPDSTPFVVKADGKVGIGTTTPNSLLQVYGTGSSVLTVLPTDVGAYGGYIHNTFGAAAVATPIITKGDFFPYTAGSYTGAGSYGMVFGNQYLSTFGTWITCPATSSTPGSSRYVGFATFNLDSTINRTLIAARSDGNILIGGDTTKDLISINARRVTFNVLEQVGIGASMNFSSYVIIDANSNFSSSLRITQRGSNHALIVEDEASDSSPFIIRNDGKLSIGVPSATAVTDTVTILGNVSASAGITGSFSGSGELINNLTASNINNFTSDVRKQISGTGVISYDSSTGVISYAGAGGTIYTEGNITGSGVIDDKIRTKPDVSFTNVTSSYFTGSAANLNYVDFVPLSTAPTQDRGIVWQDSASYELRQWTEVPNVHIKLGQQVVTRAHNNTGETILKGTVVHLTGANNQPVPRIAKADWTDDYLSANTLGVTNNDILQGGEGYVVISGLIEGIDTNSFTSGDILYLSGSGEFSNVKAVAPNHLVIIGQVIRNGNSSVGSIFVKVQNGYEIDELHNVLITGSSNYDLLMLDSDGLWKNTKTLSGSYAINLSSSTEALKITQRGEGNALLVEDSSPDSTPFVIKGDGKVGIGTTTPDANLQVVGTFNQGNNTTIGIYSHAEGQSSTALGDYSHAEGIYTEARASHSHAEGNSSYVLDTGEGSHAEGYATQASGASSHTEGAYTETKGYASHAEGYWTIAHQDYQHVGGVANAQSDALFIIGNGTATNSGATLRKNIFEIFTNNVVVSSSITASSGYGFKGDGSQLINLPLPDLSSYATLTGVSGSFVSNVAATASLARLDATNTFTAASNIFNNDVVINGTASIAQLNTVNQNSLIVGDKYITIMSGSSTHVQLDGAGILFGSGSFDSTTGDQNSVAHLVYRKGNAPTDFTSDYIEIYPGLRVIGNLTASNFVGNLTGSFNSSNPNIIDVDSSTDALRITQRGLGNAIVVEDGPSPDASPFIVDANGYVGIGMYASPSYRLGVYGDILITGSDFTGYGGNKLRLYDANTMVLRSGSADNYGLALSVAGNDRLNVLNNGNVGIGITQPVAKLHVNGNSEFDGGVRVQYSAKISNYSLTASSDYVVSFSGSNLTGTLPSAANLQGAVLVCKNLHTSSLFITASGGTIDGSTTGVTIFNQYTSFTFISDNTNWLII